VGLGWVAMWLSENFPNTPRNSQQNKPATPMFLDLSRTRTPAPGQTTHMLQSAKHATSAVGCVGVGGALGRGVRVAKDVGRGHAKRATSLIGTPDSFGLLP
jgi:hypothetical protein